MFVVATRFGTGEVNEIQIHGPFLTKMSAENWVRRQDQTFRYGIHFVLAPEKDQRPPPWRKNRAKVTASDAASGPD